MEKYKLCLRWFSRLGIFYSTVLVTLFAVICSIAITMTVELLVFGQIRMFTIIAASLAPFIIAPVGAFILLNLVFKLDNEKQKLGYFSSIEAVDPAFHRAYLIKHAEHELAKIKRYGGTAALLIIELDDFDTLTGDYGYFAGIEVLQKIDAVLREETRNIDLVGRFGGEGFLAFLPETYCSGALLIAERICKTISLMEIEYGKHIIKVTASIGIAICTLQTEDIDSALATAERLLYQAKYLGNNQVLIEQNCSKYCFCTGTISK